MQSHMPTIRILRQLTATGKSQDRTDGVTNRSDAGSRRPCAPLSKGQRQSEQRVDAAACADNRGRHPEKNRLGFCQSRTSPVLFSLIGRPPLRQQLRPHRDREGRQRPLRALVARPGVGTLVLRVAASGRRWQLLREPKREDREPLVWCGHVFSHGVAEAASRTFGPVFNPNSSANALCSALLCAKRPKWSSDAASPAWIILAAGTSCRPSARPRNTIRRQCIVQRFSSDPGTGGRMSHPSSVHII